MYKLFYYLILLMVIGVSSIHSSQAQNNNNPCKCCEGPYQDFAFWVGEWEVYDSAGLKLLGENSIVFQQDSCVMRESWKSASSPYTGTSYNFYDRISQQWRQIWIDNQGANLDMKGGLDKQGHMVLVTSPLKNEKDEVIQNRITWIALTDGRVRQLWEATKDGGGIWQIAFDGYYQRKK